ncbi:MAG: CDP-alcohol phosphatidyltransferase family protein [Candidatus Bathyarchaeota archaeon]|nr:CDP-alcohol phosphatidyltransferase family protein [Candidatus Bathyarchaeota archaeon]
MNKKALVPSGVSALRLVALPLFLYFFGNGATAGYMVVFGLAQLTDLVDGYVARKLGVASKFGAYFDAATDFVLVTGIFVAFTLSNYYPAWILLLIAASFTQFIVTSRFHKKLYDPLGKYIGSVLYIAIGLTLLSPTAPVFMMVEVGFSAFVITSFVTRTVSLTGNSRRTLLIQRGPQQTKPRSA